MLNFRIKMFYIIICTYILPPKFSSPNNNIINNSDTAKRSSPTHTMVGVKSDFGHCACLWRIAFDLPSNQLSLAWQLRCGVSDILKTSPHLLSLRGNCVCTRGPQPPNLGRNQSEDHIDGLKFFFTFQASLKVFAIRSHYSWYTYGRKSTERASTHHTDHDCRVNCWFWKRIYLRTAQDNI